jgi:hypothetical protein
MDRNGQSVIYLDTHIVCWLYEGDVERLSEPAAEAIESADYLLVSPMVDLELQYLYEIDRISAGSEEILAGLAEAMFRNSLVNLIANYLRLHLATRIDWNLIKDEALSCLNNNQSLLNTIRVALINPLMKGERKMKKILAVVIVMALVFPFAPASAQEATRQDVRNAILGEKEATSEMDVNQDGKVDVADVVNIPVQPQSGYIGTMSFDPQFALAPQSVDLTVDEKGSEATFNIENSPFFPASFEMNGSFSDDAVVFDSNGFGTLPKDDSRNPLPKAISWNLNIDDVTQGADGMMLEGRFTMTYTGFKPNNEALAITGTLYLKGQAPGEGLSFENADDMESLAAKYPAR